MGQHVIIATQAAVKILLTTPSTEQIKTFQHEAQILGSLKHPNIVRALDFDIVQGIPFFVMDYYPDGTLRQRYPKGTRIPLSTVVSYIKQIADALQHAHDKKLIHRDVKPQNMLIGPADTILLSDFGIATIAHETISMSTQAVMGSIPYMAPEQIQAKARPASDQYALAVVSYEWLAGERPFDGSYTEVFAKHLNMPPPPLQDKIPHLAPEVEETIFKALTKDPKQRFVSIQAFASALEAASQSEHHPSTSRLLQPVNPVPVPPMQQAQQMKPLPVNPVPMPPMQQAQQMKPSPVNPVPMPPIQQIQPVNPVPMPPIQQAQQMRLLPVNPVPMPPIQQAQQMKPSPVNPLPIPMPVQPVSPIVSEEEASPPSSSLVEDIVESWGRVFYYSLPYISDIPETLPFFFSQLFVSTAVVALYLWFVQHNWNWWLFGGSIGGVVILYFGGFIDRGFLRLIIATILGLSWGVMLGALYFILRAIFHLSLPGFVPWIIGIVALPIAFVGSSIHCYLFKEVAPSSSLVEDTVDNWGDVFSNQLPYVYDIPDTLPFFFAQLLVSTAIVALYLWFVQHNWNWWLFGGSIGGVVILYFCGFIKSSFLKLIIATTLGLSWGVMFGALYFILMAIFHLSLPGFVLWIIGIVALPIAFVGSSIHCYLFKEVTPSSSLVKDTVDNWGDVFYYQLPSISDIPDTLPFFFSQVFVSTAVVALYLWLVQHNWNWWLFGGSIGGVVILYFSGFIKSSFLKLIIATILGLSWGVMLGALYFILMAIFHLSLLGFVPWIIGIVALPIAFVGSSIHCYLFKEAT